MAKNSEKYAYLNRPSTEQLEELLRMDVEESKPGNEDVVFHILEVIEQRENEHPTGRIPDVDKAWAEFQEYYNVPEGADTSLYPCETVSDDSSENTAEHCSCRMPRMRRWLKQGLVAVIAIAVVFGGIVVAQAAGVDVFGTIGRWTNNVFHFDLSADETSTSTGIYVGEGISEYAALQETLASVGIDENLAPTWFPVGFNASDPEILTTNINDTVCLELFNEKNGQYISIEIIRYNTEQHLQATQFEKDANNVEQYSNEHQTFYILSNADTITATWSNDLIMMQLSGNIPKDDLKKIIDSIGVT